MVMVHSSNSGISFSGTALTISGSLVIISGKSAVGKSDLGLELIDRGHKFVADDVLELQRVADRIIVVTSSHNHLSSRFMHVRNLGFINVAKMFSDKMVSDLDKLQLALIIELSDDVNLLSQDLISGAKARQNILGVAVAKYNLYVGGNRPLALLVELVVKYHQQNEAGYDANTDFLKQHSQLLSQ
jgi:HPr kinase/phosphorylase